MRKFVSVGVTCRDCGEPWNRTVSVDNEMPLEQVEAAISSLGMTCAEHEASFDSVRSKPSESI